MIGDPCNPIVDVEVRELSATVPVTANEDADADPSTIKAAL